MSSSISFLVLLLIMTVVLSEDNAEASSYLRPKTYDHQPFNARQFQEELKAPESTKQGPVLFPNDAPPPPRPPLIVTSRPLIESISRSELGGNNTIPQPTHVRTVIRPFLARVKDYQPFHYHIASEPSSDYQLGGGRSNYGYEDHTPLPPIYKAIADHAKLKVHKLKNLKNKHHQDYHVQEPSYNYRKAENHHNHEDYEDEQSKNYAFSYAVKDQKTGDDFSHRQHSSGSATNGEYRVRLPDGRMQIVSYKADENGYHADVRYDDEGKVDDYQTNNYKPNYIRDNFIDDDKRTDDYAYNKDDVTNNFYGHYKVDDSKKFDTPSANNDYINQYTDLSKEYYNDDFSSEFDSKNYDYTPHKNKFSSLINKDEFSKLDSSNSASKSSVTPSYDELKDLLVTKKAYNTIQPYYTKSSLDHSPSSTPATYDVTTERVVLIGGKRPSLYTSVSSSVPIVTPSSFSVTPSPFSVTPSPNYNSNFVVSSTPQSYLVSTIASLRNNVDLTGPKPILSNSYLDRINKYLRFK